MVHYTDVNENDLRSKSVLSMICTVLNVFVLIIESQTFMTLTLTLLSFHLNSNLMDKSN